MPIYPISFSIPEKKIINYYPTKIQDLAFIIPGNKDTYIFDDEDSYYKDYQNSKRALTCKKGGWDCLRHYEILANACVPFFENLDNCPKSIMINFPKEIVLKAMNSLCPESYIEELVDYTKKNLTTKTAANYILKTINKTPKSILYLSKEQYPDYLRCLTLIGFKELIGKECYDYPRIEHIYDDYSGETTKLYGKGFTYSKIIPSSYKSDEVTELDIINKKFDIVIYGSYDRGALFWDLVNKVYDKSEIVLLCGEDQHDMNLCPTYNGGNKGYNSFIRELIE